MNLNIAPANDNGLAFVISLAARRPVAVCSAHDFPRAAAFIEGARGAIAAPADVYTCDRMEALLACAGLDADGARRIGARAARRGHTCARALLARGAEDLCDTIAGRRRRRRAVASA